MEAVVLAGGFGTRLRPLTYTRPKPLLPVGGRPMVDWVLDRLPDEVDHVVVAVNWQAAALEAHFSESANVTCTVVRETVPLGTGGAIANCSKFLGDEFLVLNGDVVSDMDLGALLATHRDTGAEATISLFEVPSNEVSNYGVARLGDRKGDAVHLAGFVEKPPIEHAPSRFINAGAYVMNGSMVNRIATGRLVSLESEIFPALKRLWGLPFEGHWIDVGDPRRLRLASRALAPEFRVGAGSVVAESASWEDSIGGVRCQIGENAALHGCLLGDDVTVADGVHLRDCTVGDGESVQASAEGQIVWTQPIPDGYPSKQVGNALRA